MDSNATASLLRKASRSSGRGSQAPESRTQRGNIAICYKSSFSCLTTMKTIGPHKEYLGTYRCLIKNILEKSLKISFRYIENEPLDVATAWAPRLPRLVALGSQLSSGSGSWEGTTGKRRRENDAKWEMSRLWLVNKKPGFCNILKCYMCWILSFLIKLDFYQ